MESRHIRVQITAAELKRLQGVAKRERLPLSVLAGRKLRELIPPKERRAA